jgi:hypothetical protein
MVVDSGGRHYIFLNILTNSLLFTILKHCWVRNSFLKDSLTYLDNIKEKKHQPYLGYSMRIEKSMMEEVRIVSLDVLV